MSALDEASEFSKAHMARLRTLRAIQELLHVAEEAANTVEAIRSVIDPLRETANMLAHAVRRARQNAAAIKNSVEEAK